MATAPPPPYPAAEEAPQYERGERSSSDFSLDLKDEERHVYDDDKEEEDAPKQTVPSGGILLDRLKAEKQGSTIIDTSTGRVLYSVAAVNHFSTYRGTQSTFKHGEDPATPPYASIDNIAVTLAPLPGENSSETVTNDKKFLYSHRRFLGTPKHFKVDGVEYTLKMKWWTTKMKFDLIPTDAPDSAPLATFQAGYWRDRGDILIHPCAIAHSLSSSKGKTAEGQIPQHSLLHNGMPTRLLDLALVAEAIYKVNLCQSSNAGAAAASASASAGAAAAAATAVSS